MLLCSVTWKHSGRASVFILHSDPTQWHGLTQRWLILIWAVHVSQPGFVTHVTQPGLEDAQLDEQAFLLSLLCNVILYFGRNMYVKAHCCRCSESVNGDDIRSYVNALQCIWMGSRRVEHTFSRVTSYTPISCVKGVIVKTEVMSGCQSICNTPLHKDSLSSHCEQSTTDTDGGL